MAHSVLISQSTMPSAPTLICAATMIVNAVLLLHFVGPSFPVYVSATVAVLLLAGGLLQRKPAA